MKHANHYSKRMTSTWEAPGPGADSYIYIFTRLDTYVGTWAQTKPGLQVWLALSLSSCAAENGVFLQVMWTKVLTAVFFFFFRLLTLFLFLPSQSLGSHDEYLAAMAQHEDKLVVVKFFDQFCRACDEIRPRFEELSRSRPSEDAAFFELEVRSEMKKDDELTHCCRSSRREVVHETGVKSNIDI